MRSCAAIVLTSLLVSSSVWPSGAALAARLPLPPELIGLDTPDGQRLLLESRTNRDFFRLIVNFVGQKNQTYCGIASAAAVLNALSDEGLPEEYDQDNLFTDDARKLGLERGGLTLEMLAALLLTRPAEVRTVYATATSLDEFRRTVVRDLADDDHFLIVNYLRSAVGQEPRGPIVGAVAGHWSPLAAYHEASDRILVLDVNRQRYVPAWIPTALLFGAMSAVDLDSGRSRGFLEVSGARTAHPPAALRAPHNRILLIVGSVLAGMFLLGVISTILVGRIRDYRRRTR